MTVDKIKKLFGEYIADHRKEAKNAMPGWGLQDDVFADELEEIRDKIVKEGKCNGSFRERSR